jgi:acyl-coenzyme A synthetase/AMP-(fatty) acid ligase
VEYAKELPKTTTGKIQRYKLRDTAPGEAPGPSPKEDVL